MDQEIAAAQSTQDSAVDLIDASHPNPPQQEEHRFKRHRSHPINTLPCTEDGFESKKLRVTTSSEPEDTSDKGWDADKANSYLLAMDMEEQKLSDDIERQFNEVMETWEAQQVKLKQLLEESKQPAPVPSKEDRMQAIIDRTPEKYRDEVLRLAGYRDSPIRPQVEERKKFMEKHWADLAAYRASLTNRTDPINSPTTSTPSELASNASIASAPSTSDQAGQPLSAESTTVDPRPQPSGPTQLPLDHDMP